MRRLFGILLLWCAVLLAETAIAQEGNVPQYPIVTVDRVRLVRESEYGKRLFRELSENMRSLQAENNALEEQLSAEELSLRDQRKTMEPAAFRELAAEFDIKVTRIRQQRKELEDGILQNNNRNQVLLIQTAAPFMFEIMSKHGAVAVLERSTVVLDLAAIDITDQVIERMNAEIGDGAAVSPSE